MNDFIQHLLHKKTTKFLYYNSQFFFFSHFIYLLFSTLFPLLLILIYNCPHLLNIYSQQLFIMILTIYYLILINL
jgi:hypothetical protein